MPATPQRAYLIFREYFRGPFTGGKGLVDGYGMDDATELCHRNHDPALADLP